LKTSKIVRPLLKWIILSQFTDIGTIRSKPFSLDIAFDAEGGDLAVLTVSADVMPSGIAGRDFVVDMEYKCPPRTREYQLATFSKYLGGGYIFGYIPKRTSFFQIFGRYIFDQTILQPKPYFLSKL